MAQIFENAHFIPEPIIDGDSHLKKIKQINQYQLMEVVGYGGSSKVFLAVDSRTESPFACKVIPVNGSKLECVTLEREVRLLRRLDHPNIVKLREVLHCKRRQMAYVILEWASIGSLQNLVCPHPRLATIASIFKQVTSGLQHLHHHGIVHRDIKPSNILLFGEGYAKLSDFGIGHSFDSADAMVGTPAYQAPEFFEDSLDPMLDPTKQDVWSLGISLFEACFGYLPYDGENMYQISWNMRNQALQIPESAPDSLRTLLNGLLDVNPDTRFDLSQILDHPFIRDAADTFTVDVPARQVPKLTPCRSLVNIPVVVCGDGYSFAQTRRSFSWPCRDGSDDSENLS
jgi:serine/threonine-protein kinase 11